MTVSAPHHDAHDTRQIALARSTLLLMGFGLVLHLLLAASLQLSPDEAHYALYGAHPDWSYFDHPPLVGWLQHPFVLAGGSDLLMRVVPMATWLIAARLAIEACRCLPVASPLTPGGAIARDNWAVGLLLLSPMLDLIGVALVPDTLLMPLALGAMISTWRLREPARAALTRHWIPLAAALALAVLAKYTSIFIVAGALSCLVRFHGRHLPRLPGFWLVAATATLAASPVVFWNAAHDWASFGYQAHHALGDHRWKPLHVLRAIAVQLAMYGPILPVAAARCLRRTSAEPPLVARRDARLLVLAFSAPVWVTAMVLAGRDTSLPHWTACGWCALIPLSASGAMQLAPVRARLLVAWQALFLGALCCVLWLGGFGTERGAAANTSAGARTGRRVPNPVADLYGWDEAARHAAALARERHAGSIAVMNWSLASRMAWYARPLPVHVIPARHDQFEIWFGDLLPGESAIVIDWSQMSFAAPAGAGAFARCTPIDRTAVVHAGRQIAHFDYLLCENWQGSPDVR